MKVLVFLEQRDGKVKSSSFEAASLASKVDGDRANIAGVLIGGPGSESITAEAKKYGIGKVYTATDSALEKFNVLSYTAAVQQAIENFQPETVIATATPMGREIMPRLAARLNAGLLTDLTDVKMDSGKIIGGLKPMYAGKVIAEVGFKQGGLRFVTIRPNAFPLVEADGDTTTEALNVSGGVDPNLTTKEIRKGQSDKPDLTEAIRIVSGGRALGNAESFKILDEAAEVIGATVGASRAAVDSGYAPHDMQVGQTGKTVNPSLYIACGISGSIQHMAGMRTSKVIVAINTDPEAPIFKVADYGIVADLFEAVPILKNKLEAIVE